MKRFTLSMKSIYEWIQKHLDSRMLWLLTANIFTIAFILCASELFENELCFFDNLIYHDLKTLISPGLTIGMKLISDLGSAYVLVAILAAFWVISFKKKYALFYTKIMTVNLLAAAGMNLLFKVFFHRARPEILVLVHATGYSFPSGHSMVSVAFYGYLIYLSVILLQKPWKQLSSLLLSMLIFFIGLSRIYLGVHYASDVVGGFLAGLAWLALLLSIICQPKGFLSQDKPK